MVDTSFEARYPAEIVAKYSKFVHRASACKGDGTTYLGPKIQTVITCLGVQHFAVTCAPDNVLIEEFKSNEGPAAFEQAVRLAEELGLPWKDHFGAEVFDPATGERWTYRVIQAASAT